jgi:hypothetical protein
MIIRDNIDVYPIYCSTVYYYYYVLHGAALNPIPPSLY